ncbi:MAG: N-acetyltransferase [Clostridia bacterium]|nr:N-acetyltransferase [Clostridia bacterium]
MREVSLEKKRLSENPLVGTTRTGLQITLRPISIMQVSQRYVDWMNEYEIVKFTESRFNTHTLDSILEWVKKTEHDDSEISFAIFDKQKEKHIGNIKLGSINWNHLYADLGLIIGDREYWSQGVGSCSIGLVANYAFRELKLHMVLAGIYQNNIGSIKAFEANDFMKMATIKEKYCFENNYIDVLEYYKVNQPEGI